MSDWAAIDPAKMGQLISEMEAISQDLQYSEAEQILRIEQRAGLASTRARTVGQIGADLHSEVPGLKARLDWIEKREPTGLRGGTLVRIDERRALRADLGKEAAGQAQADEKLLSRAMHDGDHAEGLLQIQEIARSLQHEAAGAPYRDAALAQEAADTALMGEMLKKASDRSDNQMVKELLGQIGPHQNDPNYTTTLFQDLGPVYTIQLVRSIDDASTNPADDQLLQMFDNALATATKSRDWNLNWNSQMWPARQRGDPYFLPPDKVLLLKYGTFSEDFLAKAGDYILFSDPPMVNKPAADVMFLNAISRNSTGALDYLTGSVNNFWYPNDTRSRVRILLSTRYVEYMGYPDVATALGRAISSAGQSPNATPPFTLAGEEAAARWVGALSGKPTYQTMLDEISQVPNQAIPDGARFGIANVLSRHIGDFKNVMPAHDGSWSWRETVFKCASEGSQGNVIRANVIAIQASAWRWVNAHMPADIPQMLKTANVKPWQDWAQQAGNLFGLSALPHPDVPVRQGGDRGGPKPSVRHAVQLRPAAARGRRQRYGEQPGQRALRPPQQRKLTTCSRPERDADVLSPGDGDAGGLDHAVPDEAPVARQRCQARLGRIPGRSPPHCQRDGCGQCRQLEGHPVHKLPKQRVAAVRGELRIADRPLTLARCGASVDSGRWYPGPRVGRRLT